MKNNTERAFPYKEGDKYGLRTKENVIIPAMYDDISELDDFGLAKVKLNDK